MDVLLKAVEPGGINIGEFGRYQQDQWKRYTNVKAKYFRDNRLFNNMIEPDGVDCSVILQKFKEVLKQIPNFTEAERDIIQQQKHEALMQSFQPGSVSILAAKTCNHNGSKSE